MTVIIPKEQEKNRLKDNMTDMPNLMKVLKPYSAEQMECKADDRYVVLQAKIYD